MFSEDERSMNRTLSEDERSMLFSNRYAGEFNYRETTVLNAL